VPVKNAKKPRRTAPRASGAKRPAKAATPAPEGRAPAGEILSRLARAYPDWGCTLDFKTPFQLLVATILAAQSTDETVNAVTPGLFEKYRGPADFAKAPEEELERAIFKTGFFRNKAKALKAMSRDLLERFGGEVPRDMEALTSLFGVGRKTASIVLGAAFGVPAIAVDTHVDRVAQRLGLTREKKDREKMEADLRAAIPEKDWIRATWLLILHGRRTCTAKKPACPRCPVADLCPYPDKTPA
jgi:endonuclease-3